LGQLAPHLTGGTQAEVAPCEPHRRQLVFWHTQEFGQLRVRRGRDLIGPQGFDFEQCYLRVFRCAGLGCGLSDLVDDLREGTSYLQAQAAALELLREVMALGLVMG
jgi:hypothetical protein